MTTERPVEFSKDASQEVQKVEPSVIFGIWGLTLSFLEKAVGQPGPFGRKALLLVDTDKVLKIQSGDSEDTDDPEENVYYSHSVFITSYLLVKKFNKPTLIEPDTALQLSFRHITLFVETEGTVTSSWLEETKNYMQEFLDQEEVGF